MTPPDTMVVYAARCTWWDYKSQAGRLASGLPCCPFCRSVLFETELADWDRNVIAAGPPPEGHPAHGVDYPKFVGWLRGRCRPSIAAAVAEFKAGHPDEPDTPWRDVDERRWCDVDMFEAWSAGARWVAERVELDDGELYIPEDAAGVEGRDWAEAFGDWLTNSYEPEQGEDL